MGELVTSCHNQMQREVHLKSFPCFTAQNDVRKSAGGLPGRRRRLAPGIMEMISRRPTTGC